MVREVSTSGIASQLFSVFNILTEMLRLEEVAEHQNNNLKNEAKKKAAFPLLPQVLLRYS